MPPARKGEKAKKQHEATGIDALPNGVLEHILGFLPAEEAVRTCVLARRWRHRWKSAAALRIVSAGGEFLAPADKLRDFMEHLLLGRGGAPLDFCEFRLGDLDNVLEDEDVLSRVDNWFRHAVGCNVQDLRFRIHTTRSQELEDLPLVSKHLTRLALFDVEVHGSFLNFSRSPNLQYLELECCKLQSESTALITFQSLKHLHITFCCLFLHMTLDSRARIYGRTRIYAPKLVSLVMKENLGTSPIFETMPSLMEASIEIANSSDHCMLWNANYWDCNCESCDNYGNTRGDSKSCVLLEGLSKAKSLRLISEPVEFIFKRDMRWCPMFSNLKNLWLNDYWCVPDDFNMLACILEHSPILEKLTLQLFSEGPEHKMELEGRVSPTERPAAISESLNTVEVKCVKIDERIVKVLRFLHVSDIWSR
ncbi:hypothetical protein EJB05_28995, partial [Eragrostis curvula]